MRSFLMALLAVLVAAAPAHADRKSADEAIMLEERVMGWWWRDNSSGPTLIVEVADDGSKREGLAEYFCLLLHKHDADRDQLGRTLVKIIDLEAWRNRRVERELGAALCPVK